MSDLDIDGLVKRLETWGTAAALGKHFLGSKTAREDCAEAAAAIRELQAELEDVRHSLRSWEVEAGESG